MNNFFKSGQVVLFQGDSITDCGRSREDDTLLSEGYPGRIAAMYNILFPDNGVKFLNRGTGGNRVIDLLNRYDEDFKALKPDFISIMIGINDVWRRYDAGDVTCLEKYENSYRTLLIKIKKDMPNTKIMIIEPFVLHSLPDREAWHEDLDPKIQVSRKLATEFADYYMPLDGIYTAKIVNDSYKPTDIAPDGVHPSLFGHSIIAEEYFKILGIL